MELDGQQSPESQNVSDTREVAGQPQAPVMKEISMKPLAKRNTFLVLGTLTMIMAGIVTGYLLSGYSFADGGSKSVASEESKGVEVSETEAGLTDNGNFSDTAEGVLVEGGIEGEGTHHLDRGTGESKYVYLTSSVFDLQSFVGKKVQVWGETISGLHAGWLMDVGKLKVID